MKLESILPFFLIDQLHVPTGRESCAIIQYAKSCAAMNILGFINDWLLMNINFSSLVTVRNWEEVGLTKHILSTLVQ